MINNRDRKIRVGHWSILISSNDHMFGRIRSISIKKERDVRYLVSLYYVDKELRLHNKKSIHRFIICFNTDGLDMREGKIIRIGNR